MDFLTSIPVYIGLTLAIITIGILKKLRSGSELEVYSWLLVIASGLYLVFWIFNPQGVWILMEFLGFAFFLALIQLSLRFKSFMFLAFGWLFHIVWDIAFYPNDFAVYVPIWYPQLCLAFDFPIAIYLMWRSLNNHTIPTA